ncbi:MAG: glycosyltransferase family 39 protein [Anaerolineae bacterium]|nr:glycosyltransferase family 39 protein [Anaerolineae bacterium]
MSSRTAPAISRRIEYGSLLAITALGAFVRLYEIGGKGLWLDEAFSIWMARQPVPEILSWLVRIDQHPPLYYLLLHLWLRFGDSAATVRALSALLSTLTIPVFYLTGRRLAGRSVGLLAALLLALSPFHVRFAQEARMYALLTLSISIALLALVHLLTDPRSAAVPCRSARRQSQARTERAPVSVRAIETNLAWIAYALGTAGALYTHHTALLFPLSANLFVLGLAWFRARWPGKENGLQPPSMRNWLLAQGAVLLLWSPWLPSAVVQAMGVYEEFWIPAPTWRTVIGAVGNLTNAHMPQRIERAPLIWALYGAALLLGVFHLRARPTSLALLSTLFVLPFAGEWLVSLRRPIFYDRTLIWTSLPLYLLLAAGIRGLRHRSTVLTASLMFATINGLSIREYVLYFEKEGWDDAAAYVAEGAEEGDLVLFNATWVQIPFDYYYRDLGPPVEERGVPVDLFDRGILEPKMSARDLPRLRALIRDRERVWLIYSHNWYTDPQGLVPAALEEAGDLLARRRFYGLEVRLYTVPE